jgi:hypothetical protein
VLIGAFSRSNAAADGTKFDLPGSNQFDADDAPSTNQHLTRPVLVKVEVKLVTPAVTLKPGLVGACFDYQMAHLG